MINKIYQNLVLVIASVVSIAVSVYFMLSNESLLYRDAKSHLNIARRVFYSLNPGATQLGGVWLPLPHILMLPTIWVNWFYYTGLSGIISSMVAFIIMVCIIYHIVLKYTNSILAGVLACCVLLTNPALLYLQSTPMTEVLLMSTTIVSVYFLLIWTQQKNYVYLILAALFICLATLVRYDAWFFFVWEVGTIAVISLLNKDYEEIETNLLLFCFLGGFGIFLWLLYNQVIFGHMLNFALGQGSGSWDTKRVASQISFATKHNIVRSVLTYSWMSIDNAGIVAICGGIIGCILYCIYYGKQKMFLIGLLFLSPYVFNIVSLYLGQSVALSKHLYPYQTYNLRYGSAMIPSVAFFLGILAKNLTGKFIVGLVIIVQCILFFTHPLAILSDAQIGNFQAERDVSDWIYHHPAKGLTLISTLSHDPVVFTGHIPMNKVVYEGNQQLWINSLVEPQLYVDRILLQTTDTTNDLVNKKLYGSHILTTYFTLDYNQGGFQVYDKKK